MKSLIFTFLKGLAMGAADVVPGVSGGTIAFITGIYERLLNAIRSIDLKAFRLLRKEGIAAAWKHIDGTFLVVLFGGIFISILSLASALEWCMHHYPQLLWAFFFGLIIASALFVGRQVGKWDIPTIIGLLAGTVIAFGITQLTPAQAPTHYWMIFLSGAIAICAMILPGISGGFILLIIGMYKPALKAVSELDFGFLALLLSGCAVGLLAFSHVLSWTFKHYRKVTLAVLTGFMIGALPKVWPWQNVLTTRTNSDGKEEPFLTESVFPGQFEGESYLWFVIILAVLGFVLVTLLEKYGERPEPGTTA